MIQADRERRFLALIPFGCIVFTGAAVVFRAGWSSFEFALIPVAVIVWLPCLLLFDRAIVSVRRGFRCRNCGYDLRGQVDPTCPECGRAFDADEVAWMRSPEAAPAVPVRQSRRGYLRLILVIAAIFALTAAFLVSVGVARRARPRGVTPTATPQAPAAR